MTNSDGMCSVCSVSNFLTFKKKQHDSLTKKTPKEGYFLNCVRSVTVMQYTVLPNNPVLCMWGTNV